VLTSARLTLGGGDLARRVTLASVLVVGAGITFVLAGPLAAEIVRGYAAWQTPLEESPDLDSTALGA